MGAIGLPVVFTIGVWVGSTGRDEAVAPSTTDTREASKIVSTQPGEPSTTSTITTSRSPTTSMPVNTASITTVEVTPLPGGWSTADVVDVVDGDTIEVRLESDSLESLRLIGTNSPERGECYADRATEGLSSLVLGRSVRLEPDTSDRDQFGRLLRYVWTNDGRFVNEITVEEGWAIAREYPPDTAHSDQLEDAQQRAMEAGIGLWAPDACGPGVPADLQISHIEYDAPGDDNFNLNGEWAEITNGDDAVVDLSGWVLKDETASHRYSFPNGFELPPESSVKVFTGCGEDSSDELYWCNTGSAVWNNDGDTGFLLDPTGNVVYSYAYG